MAYTKKSALANKFVKDQILYVISLKSIAEKKNIIKNSLLPNLDIYNLQKIQILIIRDNLKYALSLKTIKAINDTLKATINAFI